LSRQARDRGWLNAANPVIVLMDVRQGIESELKLEIFYRFCGQERLSSTRAEYIVLD
jgi:hypothetical protein